MAIAPVPGMSMTCHSRKDYRPATENLEEYFERFGIAAFIGPDMGGRVVPDAASMSVQTGALDRLLEADAIQYAVMTCVLTPWRLLEILCRWFRIFGSAPGKKNDQQHVRQGVETGKSAFAQRRRPLLQ
jgi:hypothetical protein